MTNKKSWIDLNHDEKMDLLRRESNDDILRSYLPKDTSESDFRETLNRARALWSPENIGEPEKIGAPPKKDFLIIYL